MMLMEELVKKQIFFFFGLLLGMLAQVSLYADGVKHALDTANGFATVLPAPWNYVVLGLVAIGNAAWSIYNWNQKRKGANNGP